MQIKERSELLISKDLMFWAMKCLAVYFLTLIENFTL